MPFTSCHPILVLALTVLLPLAAVDVPLHGMFETSTTNSTDYDNKFRDVLLEATFTSPSGERQIPFWGFFDGDGSGGGDRLDVTAFPADNAGEISGTVWKLRFMPDELGSWTYTWAFDDGSGSGSGSFDCVAVGAKPGVLNPSTSNPRWLETADGTPFFPKNTYVLPGEQLCYPVSTYAPAVYQKYVDLGANCIVFPWLPIWSWNTSQTYPDNGPADRNLLLWYQTADWQDGWYDESPDVSIYDSDRMNLFTWKRLEQHLSWLAEREVYSWGFQGFHIKRSFGLFPQNFAEDKYEWYIRYCMARLAPYYNLLWNNTWESSANSEEFKELTQDRGFDPWRRIYLQVGSNSSRYDVLANDRKVDFIPDSAFDSKPMWSTEGNELWGADENDWDRAWRFILDGAMCLPTETRNPYSGGNLAIDWDRLGNTAMQRLFHAFTFVADEVDFAPLRPHRELVAGADSYCSAEPGRQYLCYDRDGSAIELTVEIGSYQVLWLDPVTDARSDGAPVTLTSGSQTFTPPSSDYKVLYLYGDGVQDGTPPSQVTGLTANAVHDALVELAWSAATDPETGVVGYEILRDELVIGTSGGLSYADTSTDPATNYSYQVQAINGIGDAGPASAPVAVTTPVFNQPPTVAISAPADGSVHPAGSPLTIVAAASDDGQVTAVAFLVITQSGGQDVVLEQTDSDGSDGWSVTWSDPAIDSYDLSATATDDSGKTTESATITITVDSGANTSPVIDAISASPATVTGTATQLSASASDAENDPLSFDWAATSLPTGASPQIGGDDSPLVTFDIAGSYTFTLTVSDGRGGSTSDTVDVTVEQAADSIQITP